MFTVIFYVQQEITLVINKHFVSYNSNKVVNAVTGHCSRRIIVQ